MRGGRLKRYHTPVVTPREGKVLAEELIKIAGPLIVQQAQAGLQHMQRGHSLVDTWSNRGEQVKRGLKRKDPPWYGPLVKTKPNEPPKMPIKESLNHGAHWRISQNAKSHSTSPGPRTVHFALSNWWDHLWQVHDGALSPVVHVLAITPPPPPLEDGKWDHLWQV